MKATDLTQDQKDKLADSIRDIFRDSGNWAVRDEAVLAGHFGPKIAAEIKIDGWEHNSYNRKIKYAKVTFAGEYIGSLIHYS